MWWLEEHNKTFFWSCVTLQIQAARKSRGKVVWKKKKNQDLRAPLFSLQATKILVALES